MSYKGRLTFARGMKVEFAVAPDQDVDFGDILVIDGPRQDRFYIRICDFKVKSRWSGMNGVQYLMNKLDDQGQIANEEEFSFYLGGNHMVKLAQAEQLCYADAAGVLYNPRTCPDFFLPVRDLEEGDAALLKELAGDLEVGCLKNSRQALAIPVGLHGKTMISEHMGVFGTTGTGKSNLIKVLAGAVLENRQYGMLIFDVHNEYYRELALHPLAEQRLAVYRSGDKGYGQPLPIAASYLKADDLLGCATFSEPQQDALYKLEAIWPEEWFTKLFNSEVSALAAELEEATGQRFQARTLGKLKSVCWNIGTAFGLPHTGGSGADGLLRELADGKVVLVEMQEVSGLAEQAIATTLCRQLLDSLAERRREAAPAVKPTLIVLEEAHRFLGKEKQAQQPFFARLVSEARKFNLGLCVVDQQPRLLADAVLAQLNTLFVLGLAARADRNKVETMCRKDILQQRNELKNLACGEAVLTSSSLRFAAPVMLHKFSDCITRCLGPASF